MANSFTPTSWHSTAAPMPFALVNAFPPHKTQIGKLAPKQLHQAPARNFTYQVVPSQSPKVSTTLRWNSDRTRSFKVAGSHPRGSFRPFSSGTLLSLSCSPSNHREVFPMMSPAQSIHTRALCLSRTRPPGMQLVGCDSAASLIH